jgi:hypothetical protein
MRREANVNCAHCRQNNSERTFYRIERQINLCISEIHFNIIFSFAFTYSKWSFLLGWSKQNLAVSCQHTTVTVQ